MKTKVTGDPKVLRDAARKAATQDSPPPYRPGTPTGYTDQQQAAMYYSRRRRRFALGVWPKPLP